MTFFAPHNNKPKVLGNNAQATADDVQNLRQGTPDYKTMLPAGKTIDQLGGWTRVSPSGTEPVYAYVDKIKGIQINVSQQPLPYEFDDDSTDQHIEELASGYNADQKMKVGGTTVYIGTSAKGPQSVIFTRDKILVLIKSLSAIDNNSWAAYISSLK
jgi:hypothetical protein